MEYTYLSYPKSLRAGFWRGLEQAAVNKRETHPN
jgi:hypothetical protein